MQKINENNWTFLEKSKIWMKMVFVYTMYFPGLILHESMHYIAAKVMRAKVTKYKLIPKITFYDDGRTYSILYGFVEFIPFGRISSDNKYIVLKGWDKLTLMLNGIAPIFLLVIPVAVLIFLDVLNLTERTIELEWFIKREHLWFFYLLAQVLWAFWPSLLDWKLFFTGLFSFTGLLFVLSIYFFLNNILFFELLTSCL